jgi:peptidoglycan pentaglycine glycine transferase (the first glycine)
MTGAGDAGMTGAGDAGMTGAGESAPTGDLRRDAAAWDSFVEATEHGSYLQLDGWARVKAPNGWIARRVVMGSAGQRIGLQVLLRRPRPLPWAFAYAPRGPVAEAWTPRAIEDLTAGLRAARDDLGRVSHLRIDPEVEADGPSDPAGALRAALADAGWRPGPSVQPPSSRVIDLSGSEDDLWSDLRKKWRQYVNKARSQGVVVTELTGDPIGPFYEIYRETARRAGFLIRVQQAYRDVHAAFAPAGRARILFALAPDGTPLASLFLVRCGRRIVEPYGGMTAAGADLRANYLLKWEAIRRAREEGAAAYDLWGLAHPGIAHFKAGFGGREVRYVGGWDLVLDPLGRRVYEGAQGTRVRWARARAGLGPRATVGTGDTGADEGGAVGQGADAG